MKRGKPLRSKAKPSEPRPDRSGEFASFVLKPVQATLRRDDGKARMVVAVPKMKPLRSEAYRRLVAEMPCISCQLESCSQAAHPNSGKAKGAKADDRLCFALCHVGGNDCHGRFDRYEFGGREHQALLEGIFGKHTRALIIAAGMWPARLPRWVGE